MHGKRSRSLHLTVIGDNSSGLVLGQKIPDMLHFHRSLPALIDNCINPTKYGERKQTGQGLARRFNAVLPFQQNRLIALSSGHCHSEKECNETKLDKGCDLIDLADAILEEGRTKEEDGNDPVEAVEKSRVVPEMRASPFQSTQNETQG
ncbi:hypothetical protein HG531_008305 [Fusarium graminearum]|nr:hypothetical protein HG531_008305 [Fusarium graminearum]